MGSSCSSSQSVKDDTSVKSEDLAMDTAVAPKKDKEETKPKAAQFERKAPEIRQKGTSFVENEFSSACDDGMSVTTPSVPQVSGQAKAKDSAAVSTDLPALSALPLPVRKLLECVIDDKGQDEEGAEKRDDGRSKREKERGRTITLYVCADRDSRAEVTYLTTQVLPRLRLLARSQGWNLNVAYGPGADFANDTATCTVARHVTDVLQAVLTSASRTTIVIPVIFLHDSLGSAVLPGSLPRACHSKLQAALTSEHKALLASWYREHGGDADGYFMVPPSLNYPQIYSADGGERQAARARCADHIQTLLDLLTQNCPDLAPQTPLQIEVEGLLEQDAASSAVWVAVQYTARPEPPTSSPQAQEILQKLRARLQDCIPAGSRVQLTTPWVKSDADPPHVSDVGSQLSALLSSKINALNSRRKTCIEKCKTVPAALLADLLDHQHLYRRLLSSAAPRSGISNVVKTYLEGSERGVLGVVGAAGAGVTCAVLAELQAARRRQPHLVVMARSVGETAGSCSTLSAVRSLAEQCCAVYGGCAADCAKGVHQTRHLLQKTLSKATAACPAVLVLDGLHHSAVSSLEWVPLPLPEHVKLIITCCVDIEHEKKLASICSPEKQGQIVQLPSLSADETSAVVTSSSLSWRRTTPDQLSSLQTQLNSNTSPLIIELAIKTWQLSCSNDQPRIQESLEKQVLEFSTALEELFGKELIEAVFGLLCASNRGLSMTELRDILSQDSALTTRYSTNGKLFPSSVLLRLQTSLEPFLECVLPSGSFLLRWRSPFVAEVMRSKYLGSDDVVRAKSRLLAHYFQGKMAEQDSTGCCLPQPFSYAASESGGNAQNGGVGGKCCSSGCGARCAALNRRRVDEEPLAIFKSCGSAEVEAVVETYVFNHEWLLKKIAASDTEQVVNDIDFALQLCKDSIKSDLTTLKTALQLSSVALDYDHKQLYAQLYGRLHDHISTLPAFECCHLRKLLAVCAKPPLHSLLPLTPCFVPPQEAEKEDPMIENEVLINQISRLPSNPQHMIALSTEKRQLLVWDIVNKRPVRTLKGLQLPRKFEMIDDFQCLLLCGRELRIYNLDTGELVIKLREVMNQKMPFFGLNRPDHVVALSRSRMYVNMMNIAKGECVATFKVGEDRFLNSLTVSDNGKTCVCGDDTQKASALLVWDLSQRKLLYDLRIPHHEFLTRFAAITSEGHYVACVCREMEENASNFIVVYDLESGTLFKRWKPGVSTHGLAISTPGVSVVAALEDASVIANDLVTGNPRWLVKGHSYPADTIRVDPRGAFVVTYDSTGHDRAIRCWDMQTGACISVWSPDSPVTACEVSADSRCVVVALAGRSDVITLVQAHKSLPWPEDPKAEEKVYGNKENKGKEFELV